MLYHAEQMLDPSSRHDWALKRAPRELPKLEEMYDFLETKSAVVDVDGGEAPSRSSVGERSRSSSFPGKTRSAGGVRDRAAEDRVKCVLCPREDHRIFKCDRFRGMSLPERKSFIQMNRMCFKCFSTNHVAEKCPDRGCPRCGGRHNSLLCLSLNQRSDQAIVFKEEDATGGSTSTRR